LINKSEKIIKLLIVMKLDWALKLESCLQKEAKIEFPHAYMTQRGA
jgi:hypothetical protein